MRAVTPFQHLSARNGVIPIWNVPNHSSELTPALKPEDNKPLKEPDTQRTAQNARPLNVDKNDRLSWLLPPKWLHNWKTSQSQLSQLSPLSEPDASAPQPPLVWLAPSGYKVLQGRRALQNKLSI